METVAGISNQAGSRSNELDKPKKVRLDTHGNLFVFDSNNHRDQRPSRSNSKVSGGSLYLRKLSNPLITISTDIHRRLSCTQFHNLFLVMIQECHVLDLKVSFKLDEKVNVLLKSIFIDERKRQIKKNLSTAALLK